MKQLMLPLIILYTTIIVSLIWGRFRFFKVGSNVRRLYVYLYDPVAAIQVITTYYHFFIHQDRPNTWVGIVSTVGYSLSLSLFWWSIITAKKLDFAFSNSTQSLLTSGPYKLVRHPFYTSYLLVWGSSTLLFNSLPLWITLAYMMSYYYFAAKSEEQAILTSSYSREYANYRQNVGMFFPRILKWKRYHSE